MTQIIEEIREAIRRDCYRPLTEQMQRWLPVIEAMEKDAARYRWLAARGRKSDEYDIYKDGCAWTIGFQCHDRRLSIDVAIDKAMK